MIRTKLHRPPVTAEHVYREHLIGQLNKNQYKPFTLVSAPAGYGKSMLISSWLEKCKCPYAWVSLNEDDNELHSFLNYIYHSVLKIHPKSLMDFGKLINANELPPQRIISETLINDLDAISGEFVFVLDDYHLIQNQQIHELLDLLLKYPPQGMHLVIITRRDPALNLSSLRAHSRMNEVRTSDLSFRKKEIARLFKHLLDADLNDETTDRLRDKTEGWVTGLRLASLTITKSKDANQILENLGGNVQLIADFLVNEVLKQQPEEMQKLLLKTALLNRFSGELIDSLKLDVNKDNSAIIRGKEFIEWLLKTNLFIISLDDKNHWFRFHHLFQQLLQKQLKDKPGKKEISEAHRSFSIWFRNNEFYEEAVKHALLAEDNQLAVQIIIDCRSKLINKEEWHRIFSLLELVPDYLVDQNPLLLISKAFCFEYRGRIPEFFAIVDQIEQILQTLDSSFPNYNKIQAEYYTIKAKTCIFNTDCENAKRFSIMALDKLPNDAQYIKTQAMYCYAYSHQMTNDSKAGIKKIEDAMQDKGEFESKTSARFYLALCGLFFMDGNLNKLKKYALLCLEISTKYELQESINISYYYLISAAYYQNEFKEANKYFEAVYRNRYISRTFYTTLCLITKAQIEASNESYASAWETVEKAEVFIDEMGDAVSSIIIAIFKDELTIYQNNYTSSATLNKSNNYNYPPVWFNYLPQLTEAKFLMAKGDEADLQEAHILIGKQIDHGNAVHNVNFLIHALALQALLFWKQANEMRAFESLSASLDLAAPGRYIRPFVDLGSQMLEMLNAYKSSTDNNKHVDTIIEAFKKELKNSPKDQISIEVKGDTNTENQFTQREKEVIGFVAVGLRNKEIAEKLFVSTDTVKKHLKNVFIKLDVNSRIQAVNKATELGYLETE